MSPINIAFQTCNNGAIGLICAYPQVLHVPCQDSMIECVIFVITDPHVARTHRNTSHYCWATSPWLPERTGMTLDERLTWITITLISLDSCQIGDQVWVEGKLERENLKAQELRLPTAANRKDKKHLRRLENIIGGCTKLLKVYIWLGLVKQTD